MRTSPKIEKAPCSFCDATGEYYENDCPACHGSGYIKMDEDEDEDLYDFLNDSNDNSC
jgi:DnaJ-class molecular chaperone